MAKASHPGRTKTRLSPPLSLERAAELNTVFLRDIADNVRAASARTEIDCYMAYGPPGSAPFFEHHLGSDVGLLEVWLPNFGDCLLHTVRSLLAWGHESAIVLNSDSPTLPTAVLVDAAEALAEPGDRMVLGPCDDGGYYLLGIKQPHRRLFEEVTWSTDRVFAQTLARAAELGLVPEVLPRWYDVDDAAALERLRRELAQGVGYAARHTAALLRQAADDEAPTAASGTAACGAAACGASGAGAPDTGAFAAAPPAARPG
jgi:rSAM/selenodomain-associated transferase 1